jgi:hypothetical protein
MVHIYIIDIMEQMVSLLQLKAGRRCAPPTCHVTHLEIKFRSANLASLKIKIKGAPQLETFVREVHCCLADNAAE